MKKNFLKQLDNTLKTLFKNAEDKGVFSGAAVGVFFNGKQGKKRYFQTYGRTRNDEKGVIITGQTLFDLASLTKPLCTVLSILHLIEKKRITRETQLKQVLSCVSGTEHEKIQIEDLLSHSSGLIAYKPFFRAFEPQFKQTDKDKLIQAFLGESLAYRTGSECLYSDVGYILLGEIIENISEQKLNDFYLKHIIESYEIEEGLTFRPLQKSYVKSANIAATEFCSWRNKIIQGEVHDEHCWLMGGAAGHAGLFGSIEAVLSLLECILNQWKDREEYSLCNNELLQSFLKKRFADQTWCLGFDTPSATGSSAGNYFSGKSIGHLGFTGTSFWIDPEKDIIVVLLTNRIHPDRDNNNIRLFRPAFHDAVMETLFFQE